MKIKMEQNLKQEHEHNSDRIVERAHCTWTSYNNKEGFLITKWMIENKKY